MTLPAPTRVAAAPRHLVNGGIFALLAACRVYVLSAP